ncbi:MAG: 2-oxoglutarate and iron-dependent oxygenase domain-containing protein [Alphaproteobacteria bacterium]|nr:2-oxoglutarate and iron-dependent oxygenase domain-containing protein [Alphaproteobacteria bacterium]
MLNSRVCRLLLLAGHGIPQSLIDRTYEAAARFHTLPMAKKLALRVNGTISAICRSPRAIAASRRAGPQAKPE